MNTVLCHYFTSDDWAVTPEQIQEETNQKPDFVVEKVKTVNDRFWLFPHIYVEIKKDTEAGFIQAMNQVVEAIGPRVGRSDTKSSFVIVGRGRHIAFFHYFHDCQSQQGSNTPNHCGLIPLYLSPHNDRLETNPNNTNTFLQTIKNSRRDKQEEVLLNWVEDHELIHSFFTLLKESPLPSI